MTTATKISKLLLVASVLLGLCCLPTAAQELCVPTATGVPGQPGLPDWWAASPAAPYDDPRWLASFGYSQHTAKFSALVDNTGGQRSLVLKWRVKGDAGVAAPGDQVQVGFYNPTSTEGLILVATREATTTIAAGTVGSGAMNLTAVSRTGTSGLWSNATVPTTVQSQARIDTFCTGGAPSVCDEWAIRLRVPTTAAAGGFDLGDVFRMWFQVDVQHEASGGGSTTDLTKFPAGTLTPGGAPTTYPEPLGSASPASPAWNQIRVAGAGTCTAGIDFLSNSDIYVTNPTGTGTQIHMTSENTFHARPHNNTAQTFNPDSIKAHFRIADWGSAVGDSPNWMTVPGVDCDVATGSGAAGSIGIGTQFDLSCKWTLNGDERCTYRPDLYSGCSPMPTPHYDHQCITAELSANTGTGVTFARDSYWNNFHFGPASKLERKAKIDIGNRGPRDVYLFVSTRNMPARLDQPDDEPDDEHDGPPGEDDQPDDEHDDQPGDDQRGEDDFPRGASPALQRILKGDVVPGRVGTKAAAALQRGIAEGRITAEDVESVMPTYTVYVWHDSGETLTTPRGATKLLNAQPSFTLFVSHDGELYGWKHGLKGQGVTLHELAPNFYRVGVDAGGIAEVVTSVESLGKCDVQPDDLECRCEQNPNDSACTCLETPNAPICKCLDTPTAQGCKCLLHPNDPSCTACEYPLCLTLWQWLLILALLVALILLLALRKRP